MKYFATLGLLLVLGSPSVVRGQTTCALPPLQTSWEFEAPVKNPGNDFGAPNVPQGKISNGQPKARGPWGPKKLRNVILIIPDGFGPASEVFARQFNQWKHSEGWNKQLGSDTVQIGSVRTRSSDSLVTDSAASATAYSCAIKTYNGAIGVDEDGNPCGTVLEAAHAAGYKTGLVATSRITHATPASFASHTYNRDDEHIIAEHLVGGTPLGHTVDYMLGGGLGFFLPNTTSGSSRPDGKDILAYARDHGYNLILNRTSFDGLQAAQGRDATKPYIGLFNRGHMNYEIDRDASKEPSLLEMAKTMIGTLKKATRNSDKGYFVMIEASRIDHAAHGNDAIGHLHDILMYNEVVDYLKTVVDDDRDERTVLIGTADHETGGLSLGGIITTGEYQWNPRALDAGKHSSGFLSGLWNSYNGPTPDVYLQDIFSQYGITDANSTELSVALELKSKSIEVHLGQSLSRRAMIKWSTVGHSGVDVNLIGYGPSENLKRLRGNRDNTEVGLFIADELRLDIPSVTSKLNDPANEEWLVNDVGRDKVEDGVRLRKRGGGGGCGCGLDHHL